MSFFNLVKDDYNVLDNPSVKVGAIYKGTGVCISTRYYDEEKGFGIFKLEDTEENTIIIKGAFPSPLQEGLNYQYEGIVEEYNNERQLKLKSILPIKPLGKKGIIAYLTTLDGIKTKAEVLYTYYGDDVIDILTKEPFKVSNEIAGIGKKSVLKWQKQLKELTEDRYVLAKMLAFGLSEKVSKSLIKKFGIGIVDRIEKNPYMLIKEVKGFGFLKCDEIALNNNIKIDSIERLMAGIVHVLETASSSGHCYVDEEEVLIKAESLLNLKLQVVEIKQLLSNNSEDNISIEKCNIKTTMTRYELQKALTRYNSSRSLQEKEESRPVIYKVKQSLIKSAIKELYLIKDIIIEKNRLYLKDLYDAEVNVSTRLVDLLNYKEKYHKIIIEGLLREICDEKGYILEEKQWEACVRFNMYESGMFILDGSAGTGKTFTLKIILEVAARLEALTNKNVKTLKEFEGDILAVAPTGRASKVATKSIGFQAYTIHKALEYQGGNGFQKNEESPLEYQIVVADETSMADISLTSALLSAIDKNTKLIFMGDIKQLQSVGAGNVLRDLMLCNHIVRVTLNVPKRQDSLSEINFAANQIIKGEPITSGNKDFFVIQRSNVDRVQNGIIECIERFLVKGFNMDEIQVLIPQKTGLVGVNMINNILQKKFNCKNINDINAKENRFFNTKFTVNNTNKKEEEIKLYIYKGDKVMHTANNYDMTLYKKMNDKFIEIQEKTVTNGECGIVESIYKKDGKLEMIVKYDDFYALYTDSSELTLSYAMTIHKSQGSQWKAIIPVIVSNHFNMLNMNIVYTAVTRAELMCAIVGENATLTKAIRKEVIDTRNTTLTQRINHYISLKAS